MDSGALQVMDITSLKAVIDEIEPVIVPSRFEKAQQPEPNTLQLGLRSLNGLIWLELSWNADAPRLVQIPPPGKNGSESTLAKQFQHGLHHMALVALSQKGFDRVVEFCWAKRPGEPIQRFSILELMGRYSNLLLLDQGRKVITIGRQVRSSHSRIRPIGTGDTYLPPPTLKGIEPKSTESYNSWRKRLNLIPTSFKSALQDCYQGISPSLALQLVDDNAENARKILHMSINEIPSQEWERIHERWCTWLEKVESKQLKISFNGPTQFRMWETSRSEVMSPTQTSLSLGYYYQKGLIRKAINKLTKQLEERLIRVRQTETNSLFKQKMLLKEASKSQSIKNEADMLLCERSVNKCLIEKAQKLYQKAKKLKRSRPLIEERVNYHQARLKVIANSEVFLEQIQTSEWEDEHIKLTGLIELKQELEDLILKPSASKKHRKSNKQKVPNPLEIKSHSGLVIQIGRNHRQNEWITLQQSRTGDLWFHSQECPGSHVILKSSYGLADDVDIQMAADLAAFFSKAKGNRKVPVVMALTDQLRRIPGALPGTVSHRNSKVMWAEPANGMKYVDQSASDQLRGGDKQ